MENKGDYSITELQEDYEKIKTEKNSPSNLSKKKKIIFNSTLSRKELNQKIKERNANRELLNDNYLEFIIHEKIKYADVDKIIDYYSDKIHTKLKEYNDNEILIKKKKEELKQLNLSIYSNLVQSVKFKNVQTKEDYYDKQIEETKKEIKYKLYQINVFQEIYNQSYKINFKLNKKLDKESTFSKIYEEQFQRYSDIYTNSINKIQRQEGKLNELNRFFINYKMINNSLISEKVQKINKLEYEILMIKNNVISYQETLEKLQEEIVEFQKIIDLHKNGYNVRKNEYNFIRKIYIKEYYKLFEIYQLFNVDDFEQILHEFKQIKKKYNEVSLRFHEYSKDIMLLTEELKNKEIELEKTKEELNHKNENANLNLKLINKENADIVNMQKNEFDLYILQIYNDCKYKENLINMSINYLFRTIYKIIHSFNFAISNSPFSFKKTFDLDITKYFDIDINDTNFKSINYVEKMNDPKFLLFVISLFKSTKIFIYEIIINVFYNIYTNLNLEQDQQNPEEEDENDKVTIIKSNTPIIKNLLNKKLKLTKQQFNLKKKIYSRNKDDILNNKRNSQKPIIGLHRKMLYSSSAGNLLNLKENSLYIKKYEFVSPKEIFKDYFKYYKKNPIVDITDFAGINKKLFVKQYTNDLVTEQKNIEKKLEEKNKRIKENSRIIKAKIEEKELNNFLKNKKNKKIVDKIKTYDRKSDSEDEESNLNKIEKNNSILKKEIEESKKPKIFKMKLNNSDTNKIHNRYEDIRKLEYNYIKNYSNYSIDPNIFNEFYFRVKKKFNEQNEKAIKSSENNINIKTTRNFKNKGLLKNYSVILPKIENKEKLLKNSNLMDSSGGKSTLNLKKISYYSPKNGS